jgi:ATP-dependent protease Clp ATPase subunit
MTPVQLEQFNTMIRQVNEVYTWMQSRKVQQISYPLDDASRTAVSESNVIVPTGTGATTLTQSIGLSGNPQNINVPAAYVGTEKLTINGVTREFPYIA